MTTFTINNKEYTHNELNLMWDLFTQDQWDRIISDIKDPEIVSTIQQLSEHTVQLVILFGSLLDFSLLVYIR